MEREYFVLEDDVGIEGRWHLDGLFDSTGTELDSREFTYGLPMQLGPPLRLSLLREETVIDVAPPLTIAFQYRGRALDFTFAGLEMPVATSRVAELLAGVARADIQRIPVCVESQSSGYEIINVISRIDCIDTARSRIQWYGEGNQIRPDLAGTPEMISRLIIDPRRTQGHHIFRPHGWEVVVIVSGLVKDALERAQTSGVTFRRV